MTGAVLSLLLIAGAQLQNWPTQPLKAGMVKATDGKSYAIPAPKAKATVVLFVTVDCPICNRYAPEITKIVKKYGERVSFFLAYTDPTISLAAVKKHRGEFGLSAHAFLDYRHVWVGRVRATVTPEAAVLTPEGKLVYRGRIDDLYANPSQRKPKAEQLDLRQALDEVLAGKAVTQSMVPAVGCKISDLP